MYSEWSGLGFSWNSRQPVHPPPRFFFYNCVVPFWRFSFPFALRVCVSLFPLFFSTESRRGWGGYRAHSEGPRSFFLFFFFFFTCFTTAVPGRTRNNKKNRCNPQKCGRNPLKRRLGGSWNRVVESTSLRWTSLTGRDLIVVVLRCSRSEWKASSRGSDWTLRRPIRVAVEYWGKKKTSENQVKQERNALEKGKKDNPILATRWNVPRRVRPKKIRHLRPEAVAIRSQWTSPRRSFPIGRHAQQLQKQKKRLTNRVYFLKRASILYVKKIDTRATLIWFAALEKWSFELHFLTIDLMENEGQVLQ